MAGRPKAADPKQAVTGRVRASVLKKLTAISVKEDRTVSELIGYASADYVKAYEDKNGPIAA